MEKSREFKHVKIEDKTYYHAWSIWAKKRKNKIFIPFQEFLTALVKVGLEKEELARKNGEL